MEQPQFPPHVPLITRSSRRAPSRRSVATLIFGHPGQRGGGLGRRHEKQEVIYAK